MRAIFILLAVIGLCVLPAAAQSDFDTSLHKTRVGKEFWYGRENGGFENFTDVSIEELGCKQCHGPTDADGNPYDPFVEANCIDCHPSADFFNVQVSQCLGCHGRQATEANTLGFSDVHRDADMVCWDCHTLGDLHGDGNEYDSMLEPDAIDVDCEDCHNPSGRPLPANHGSYDPHGGKVHCKSCHTQSVVSCYNCHFESQVEAHVKRAKQPLGGFVMLVNREEDGKVHPATFQSLSYQGSAFTAFAPYTAHTISGEGRDCGDCHNMGGSNAAITQYNDTGEIHFAAWDDSGKTLSWIKGVVPIPEDYQNTLKMDFITYDGDVSDPPGPSSNWSSIGKDTWDGSQMFFASPLSRDQMAALGFVVPMEEIVFAIKPGSCPNAVGVNSRGVLPAAILGGEAFDVHDVDVSSLALEGVPALRSSYDDVAAPCEGGCCMGDSFDGYEDLVLKFSTPAILQALSDMEGDGEYELTLTGSLMDGTPIEATDTIVLRGRANWRWSRGQDSKRRGTYSPRER